MNSVSIPIRPCSRALAAAAATSGEVARGPVESRRTVWGCMWGGSVAGRAHRESGDPCPDGEYGPRDVERSETQEKPTPLVGYETVIFSSKAEYGVRLMVELGRQ